jgi:DivIVA protein
VPDFNRQTHTIERSAGRRAGKFGELGDRLARTFSRLDQTQSSHAAYGAEEHPVGGDRSLPWDEPLPRFPIARHGYDCTAVDGHIAELEAELLGLDRELAELRARTPSEGEVVAEIERVGEQTSAILIAAHDQAQETSRSAQAQADRCMADAAANAVAITSEAKRQVRELESEKQSIECERRRLLEDIRGVAAALSSLADGASERFAPHPEDGASPDPGDERTAPDPGGEQQTAPQAEERFVPNPEDGSAGTGPAL